MKKVIIFGSSGRLGFYLSKNLKLFFKIYPIGKVKNSYVVNMEKKNEIFSAIQKINPDAIVNCVAATNVDKCTRNYAYAFKGNVLAAKNIVWAIKKLNKKIHLIHFSTDQIYNNKLLNKNSENKVKTTNNYSKTKYLAEKKIKEIFNHTIIRTNFFGKLTPNHLSFSDFIIKYLRNNIKIKLASNIIYSPIHIKLLNDYLRIIINKKFRGTYNIGSKDYISKYDFALKVAKYKKLNKNLISKHDSNFLLEERPLNTFMNSKKFEIKIKKKIPSLQKMFKFL